MAGQGCIKVLMCVFNLLFLGVGIALAACGGFLYVNYNEFFSYADNGFANISIFSIIVGSGVALISFAGLFGAFCKSRFLLMIYSTLLTIILFGLVAVSVLGFMYHKNAETVVTKSLRRAVDSYDVIPVSKVTLDWAQNNLECCGINGPSDYAANKTISICSKSNVVAGNVTISQGTNVTASVTAVPSCYDDNSCSGKLYTIGCQEKFMDYVKSNLLLVGGGVAGIVALQVVCIVFACILIKTDDR